MGQRVGGVWGADLAVAENEACKASEKWRRAISGLGATYLRRARDRHSRPVLSPTLTLGTLRSHTRMPLPRRLGTSLISRHSSGYENEDCACTI